MGHIDIMGLRFPVKDVDSKHCLPFPEQYKFPSFGGMVSDFEDILISLQNGRSLYVWGSPGTGKDAFFHAFSYLTRTPTLLFQIQPGADIQHWFFTRAFNTEGTFWEEGDLLKALHRGFPTPNGPIPYLIVLSDFDRADVSQAETLRLIMDSVQGRVMGPGGVVYPVLAGTQIVATANTPGGGDPLGRLVSANVLDASLLDRFERKIRIRRMDWRDEGLILKAKFPVFHEAFPEIFSTVAAIASKLRLAIDDQQLYGEFSHRSICSVLSHAQDVWVSKRARNLSVSEHHLLNTGFRIWLDGLIDAETREAAVKIIDPFIRGGALNEGDVSHIRSGGLPLPDFIKPGSILSKEKL